MNKMIIEYGTHILPYNLDKMINILENAAEDYDVSLEYETPRNGKGLIFGYIEYNDVNELEEYIDRVNELLEEELYICFLIGLKDNGDERVLDSSEPLLIVDC